MKADFRSLIDYYEHQSDSFVPYNFRKKPSKVEEKKQKKKKAHTIIKADTDKKSIADDIDVINDTLLDKKIKIPTQPGFDISALNKILQQELIFEYKKYRSFSHPNISFGECVSCIRQHYYKRKNYPLNLNKLFSFAYLFFIKEVNDFLLDLLRSVYNFEETDKIIESKKYYIKGNVHAVDAKTGFLYYVNIIEPDTLSEHKKQSNFDVANVQAYILNNEYDYDISNIVLIYLTRDLKKVEKYTLPVNDSAKDYLEHALILKQSLIKNVVPDKLGNNERECNFCMFKSFCKKDEVNKDNKNIVMLM